MSNLSSLLTTIKNEFDLDANYDTLITQAINEVQQEINGIRFKFLEANSTISVVSGTVEYELADDFFMPGVFYISGAPLIKGDYEAIVLNPPSGTGQPKYYALKDATGTGDAMKAYIGCPTSDGNYTVDYTYYKKLADLSGAGDESMISKVYNDKVLIKGARYKLWLALEDEQKAAIYLPEYQDEITKMKNVLPVKRWDG